MKSRSLRKGAMAGLAAVALTLPFTPANAAPQAQNTSTPVPINTPEGAVMSYAVNAKKPDAATTRQVERAIERSGGNVVQSWPQIGVVIARSTHADFLARVRTNNPKVVESAGPTRTAPVAEAEARSARARTLKQQRTSTDVAERQGVERVAPASDPREAEQWDMRMIRATDAHRISDGSNKVTVGVIDSGIDGDHPDLKPNLDVSKSINCSATGAPDKTPDAWRNTTSYHGTHVAGTIAAARNGTGIVGVAPGVRLASVKVVDDGGFIYPEYAVCGFMWAGQQKMDVTNNSYYVDPFEFWCGDQVDQAPAKEAVRRAVEWSTKQGTVHAAAAGNSSYDIAAKTTDKTSPNDSTAVERKLNRGCNDIPTELDGVVSVSSVDDKGVKSGFSNYGFGKIDVAAPGSRILSTMPIDDPKSPAYGLLSGTSMASPHVAGVLALMKSAHPKATPAEMIDLLRKQAQAKTCDVADNYPNDPKYPGVQKCIGDIGYTSFYGTGIVDAQRAITKG